MWNPGTFIHVKGKHVDDVFERGGKRGFPTEAKNRGARIGLVISVRQTGYGTLGPKWDVIILSHGRILDIRDAWKLEDMFVVHKEPK